MNDYDRALALREETIAHRRYFHTNAEVGMDLPKACAYVAEQLRRCGIQPKRCGRGITATIGSGSPCILLRADMDALPMAEESGEPFACAAAAAAHACGHDIHGAMLLTAAKLLKQREETLRGTVKLMFQPGEELLAGAAEMIDHGILEDPPVQGALALHVAAGRTPPGTVFYNAGGVMMNASDAFCVTVTGRGCHGACPHQGIDPIHIAVHIYLGLQALVARECAPGGSAVLTVGCFSAGSAGNVIPGTAQLRGSLRTGDPEEREKLIRRIREIADSTAAAYGGSARVEWTAPNPALVCDRALTEEMVGYLLELGLPGGGARDGISVAASEDFARIARQVPAAFLYLSAGWPDRRGDEPAHSPRVRFNEDVCPMGAACLAHCAARWLEKRGKTGDTEKTG